MPISRSLPAAGALAALLTLCSPAAAAGPVLAGPLKRCYVSVAEGRTEPVVLSAAGFGANAPVEVRLDGAPVATVTSSGDGRIYARVHPAHQSRGERRLRIELRERDDPRHRIEVTSRVSALSVRLRPRSARARSVVTWTGRGFTAPGPVHVHYLKGGAVRRSVRLAVPRRPCGVFRVRRAQFPFSPSLGAWVLQVDQQRPFTPVPATPFVQLPVTVQRVPTGS
ncbi:MAG: hypothetical protein AVDCRST_MAG38-102 [uncultured Solirubrobacteraceae bacterium]|uniref:Uncharacterized protein n=1 Tax=uncultured Solirubrobacteraceae bacterium TaxID=1162706 RepID=A0A6J4R7N8_9ACTN|nr:MAG: hypothetical protein AVDCRST_MAG38-102 [uncultured Solirubrobacteraceae bacterium]